MASGSTAVNSSQTSPTLLDACRHGELQLVQQLISDSSCDLAVCDDDGNTALHIAAMHGHLSTIEKLASSDILPYPGENKDGKTPLHLLSTAGYAALLKRIDPTDYVSQYFKALNGIADTVALLSSRIGCTFHVQSISNTIILHQACYTGNTEAVRKLLSRKDSNPMARDSQGLTLLHIAALGGNTTVAVELIKTFKCSVDSVGSLYGRTPLYYACESGNVALVRILISEYGSDPMARDRDGETPLHVAALCGREEVVRELVDKYKCPVDSVGDLGQSVLHNACEGGNATLVRILISEYGSDPMGRDNEGKTPLHVAAFRGREEVVRELVDRYKCPVDSVGDLGQSVLHNACEGGNATLVRILISEYGSDPMGRDNEGKTPLHVAALCGRKEVVRELVDRYKCPVNSVDSHGRTALHKACYSENVALVRILISEYGSDPMASDREGDPPLLMAALNGREEVVRELVDKYRCPVDSVGANGRTVLHSACQSGNVALVRILISEYGSDPMVRDSEGDTPLHVAAVCGREEVVRILISEYGSDPMARDRDGDTPLHVAALWGREEVVRELVDRYKCPVDSVGFLGQTVLHKACESGNVDLVRKLLLEYGSDLMARDSEGYTPLHVAALNGTVEVVRELVDRSKCPLDYVGADGQTVLHCACVSGNVALVSVLVSEFAVDPMCVDDNGNTPMHIAALYNKVEIIKTLINVFHCFPCIRNNQYKSPYHLAIEKHYKECSDELALHSEAKCIPVIPKVLVAGNNISGKTTLVKALKTLSTESDSQAVKLSAHSGGFQLIQLSSIGEVAFFEIPCEPAQAAAVEILTSTSSCCAIVVVDVSKGKQKASHEVGYWLSFFSCSYKGQGPLQVTVFGSHVDMLAPTVDAQEMLKLICSEVSQSFYHGNIKVTGSIAVWLALERDTLKSPLEEMIAFACRDNPGIISNGAVYLLKLLQVQLQGKSVCQLSQVSELVTAMHFYPEGDPAEHLLIYLRELDKHGFLQIVNDKGNTLLILNIVSVLNTLSAQVKENASVGLLQTKGIITEKGLQAIFLVTSLAKYFTQLQLCLQVVNSGRLHVISSELQQSEVQQLGENSPLIFFPCFIHTENSHSRKWIKPKQVFFQGFFIGVAGKYEYLPLRFFHVLLLNIASTVAFPSSSMTRQFNIHHCTIWKSGMQWQAANGIEVFIEMARDQKGIIVAGRSAGDEERECVGMLSAVMEDILEAKSKFMKLEVFVISPGELQKNIIPESDVVQLFDVAEVQNALTRSYESIPSTDCGRVLQQSQFSLLQTYTFWSKSEYNAL